MPTKKAKELASSLLFYEATFHHLRKAKLRDIGEAIDLIARHPEDAKKIAEFKRYGADGIPKKSRESYRFLLKSPIACEDTKWGIVKMLGGNV